MELEKVLKNTMKEAVDKGLVAGANLLVQKNGREICYVEAGMADQEEENPIRRDTIYRLYSQTKPVTAAAVMILVERGQLDLCQQVSEFLPGFKNPSVWAEGQARPAVREVQVHDLLRMASGLGYPDTSSECGRQTGKVFEDLEVRMYGEHPMTTQELANAVGSCVLDFDPGSSYRYGTSADVLGAIVEVVSEMPFSEFLKKELFDPLGMKDTGFWVPEEKQYRLAKTYESVDTEEENKLVLYTGDHLGIQNRMKRKPAFESGGAGLASTLDDYMRFASMLLEGGELNGVRILQKETVRFMTGGSLTEPQQKTFNMNHTLSGFSYANLLRICKDSSKAPFLAKEGEYGWDGWLGPYFENFPKERMTILIGMQKKDAGTWQLSRKLRNILVSRLG